MFATYLKYVYKSKRKTTDGRNFCVENLPVILSYFKIQLHTSWIKNFQSSYVYASKYPWDGKIHKKIYYSPKHFSKN